MRRTRLLLIAACVLEAAQLPVYGWAFGGPVLGLIAVRAVLTVVLAAFALRQQVVRVVLGALRLMAALVGIVMATLLRDEPALLAALVAFGVLDGALGFALMMRR